MSRSTSSPLPGPCTVSPVSPVREVSTCHQWNPPRSGNGWQEPAASASEWVTGSALGGRFVGV
jgi:hypothetical protein